MLITPGKLALLWAWKIHSDILTCYENFGTNVRSLILWLRFSEIDETVATEVVRDVYDGQRASMGTVVPIDPNRGFDFNFVTKCVSLTRVVLEK